MYFISIGYGVFTEKKRLKDEFLLEYGGNLISEEEALDLEEMYLNNNQGCFLFFFEHQKKKLWLVNII